MEDEFDTQIETTTETTDNVATVVDVNTVDKDFGETDVVDDETLPEEDRLPECMRGYTIPRDKDGFRKRPFNRWRNDTHCFRALFDKDKTECKESKTKLLKDAYLAKYPHFTEANFVEDKLTGEDKTAHYRADPNWNKAHEVFIAEKEVNDKRKAYFEKNYPKSFAYVLEQEKIAKEVEKNKPKQKGQKRGRKPKAGKESANSAEPTTDGGDSEDEVSDGGAKKAKNAKTCKRQGLKDFTKLESAMRQSVNEHLDGIRNFFFNTE